MAQWRAASRSGAQVEPWEGHVVSVERNPRPSYLKLHRASCAHILGRREPGTYTERAYMKICSTSLTALERWARAECDGELDYGCACTVHADICLPGRTSPPTEARCGCRWDARETRSAVVEM
jgi:hypothetical protein